MTTGKLFFQDPDIVVLCHLFRLLNFQLTFFTVCINDDICVLFFMLIIL